VIALTLDAAVQQRLELLATETAGRLGPRQSLAMVLADAATGEILASVGSTGHLDTGRAGAIDMTRATAFARLDAQALHLRACVRGRACCAGDIDRRYTGGFCRISAAQFRSRLYGRSQHSRSASVFIECTGVRLLEAVGLSGCYRGSGAPASSSSCHPAVCRGWRLVWAEQG
jgi:hypothetical protein